MLLGEGWHPGACGCRVRPLREFIEDEQSGAR